MKKETGIQNAFKAGIWYTISTLLVKSIGIISTPLFTRMMTTADYGLAATFNTWYSLFAIVCSLNVGYSVSRAKVDFGDKFEKYIGVLQVLCTLVTLAFFGIVMIFIRPAERLIGMDRTAIIILFVYLLFGTVVSIYQSMYRFRYEYKQNICISIFIAVATVIFSLVFISFASKKYMGKIIGTALPAVILGIYFWIDSIKRKTINFNREYCKYALAFSLPLIVHSISIYVLGQSDRLMVKAFCGDSITGIYSLVYQYAVLVMLVTNSVNQAWNPWFHDMFAEGNFNLIRNKIKPLLMLGAYLAVGCVAVAPEAVLLLGGEEYLSGLSAVLPLVIGVAVEFVYTQYVIIEIHQKKTYFVSLGTGIAAILNLCLNYMFIPKFGYVAAAYTTLASYVVLYIMHLIITRYALKIHIYQDRVVLLIMVGMMICCSVTTLLYDTIVARYGLLIVFSILFFLYNKDFIMKKLKRKK